MKAILCTAFGPVDTLVTDERPALAAGAGEVVIDVAAAGVNFPDGLIVEGRYQTKPPLPFTPGCEVSGTISAMGDGVQGFAVGDRVVAFTGIGGFAEQAVAKAARTYPLPVGIDPVVAAGLLVTYGTSYHGLKDRAALKAGETLLVLGAAGGVGLAAVELGKAMGARVIAAASSAEKLAVARDHGADELIDYAAEDLRARIKELTDGKGVDIVYDPVGGDLAIAAVKSMAWGGRHLIVGFAAGPVPAIPANLLLLKSASSMGVLWGASVNLDPVHHAANIAELLGWVAEGRLKPAVDAVYPLEKTAEAIEHVMGRRVRGKVIVQVKG